VSIKQLITLHLNLTGYHGLPIDDSPAVLKKAFAFYTDEIKPRREFHSDLVTCTVLSNAMYLGNNSVGQLNYLVIML